MTALPPLTADDEAIIRQAMPESAREIVGCIGFDAAMLFINAFGGQRVFIKRDPEPDNAIVRVIGIQAATLLGELLGGHHHEIPKMTRVRSLLRDLAVCAGFDGGSSPNSLAVLHGLTCRHIRKILQASPDIYPRQR